MQRFIRRFNILPGSFLFLIVIFLSLPAKSIAQVPGYCTNNKKAIALYVEADNFRVRRQFKQAEELLKDALQKDKNFCEAYYRLSLVYHDMRDSKRTVEILLKGLEVTSEPKKKKHFHFSFCLGKPSRMQSGKKL